MGHTGMSRFAQLALVSLVLGGLLFILLLPQPHLTGSYQATHGPTVTLRSLRAPLLLMLAIATAAGWFAGRCYRRGQMDRDTKFPLPSSVLLC